MYDLKNQITDFLKSCDEIENCKFIMAPTKIKGLLKCIVNSPDLYLMFQSVTENFNYPEVKAASLIPAAGGERGRVALPQDNDSRLSFIFCLLVEFDRDGINLNDFLSEYFLEDGSYFASYRSFCNKIIEGLREGVLQKFNARILQSGDAGTKNITQKAEFVTVIVFAIAEEREYLAAADIPEEDKVGGLCILDQLTAAIYAENEPLIDALICGYNYFAMYHRCVSDGIAVIIKAIADYERML